MRRTALIGSCVTRDIWQFLPPLPQPFFFLSRTGLISIMAPKPAVDLPFSEAAWASDFQARCVTADVCKTVLDDLQAFKPDIIILDFIDERFDVVSAGGSYVTLSHDLQTAGLSKHLFAMGGRAIARDSSDALDLWRDAARRFVQFIRSSPALCGAQVLLHCAPWARVEVQGTHLDGAALLPVPEMHQITFDRVVSVQGYGAMMRDCYEAFAALMPEAKLLRASRETQVAASGHVWGQSPFHYIHEYYEDIYAKLLQSGVPGA